MLFALLGWISVVALQLQQASLWPLHLYGALVALAALAAGGRVALVFGVFPLPKSPLFARWAAHLAQVVVMGAGVALGFGLTGARAVVFANHALNPELEGQNLVVTGRVASMPRRGQQGERFDFRVESARLDGQAVQLPPRVQLTWYTGREPSPDDRASPGLRAGERWTLTVRLRRPHGSANPHGFDRERWLWEQGIQATGYVRTGPRDAAPKLQGQTRWHLLEAARQDVVQAIKRRVADSRSAGVLAALVAGDQAAIERDDWDLFRATGVAHLMSISGLHVTMFAWLALALVRWGWRHLASVAPRLLLAVPTPVAAAVGGLALASAYALFSGWGVPSQRTLLMLAVVLGLRLGARQWPWPQVWALALCAVLLLDPMALLREQAVVTLGLAPLTLLLFGQFSLVGLLANVLAIPWVTLVVTPLAMLGVGFAPLWDLAARAVQELTWVLQWLATWPFASIQRPVGPWPLSVAAVVGCILLVLRLPWAIRLAGLLLVWPAVFWAPARPAQGEFDLLALDVGQGSAVLVRTAQHSLLYDTGPRYNSETDAGQQVVIPMLRSLGEQPDTVVVSHRDSDHAGGAESVRAAYPRARWFSSFDESPARHCLAGQHWTWDGVVFEVLHPGPDDYTPSGGRARSSNAMSCVLRIFNPRQSVWLAGDLPAEQEVRLALARPDLRAQVMLAPHHGSLTCSSPVLLNTLHPRWVLVQAGYRNAFRHPASDVLDRYRERGIAWVNSPDCGAAIGSTNPWFIGNGGPICLQATEPKRFI